MEDAPEATLSEASQRLRTSPGNSTRGTWLLRHRHSFARAGPRNSKLDLLGNRRPDLSLGTALCGDSKGEWSRDSLTAVTFTPITEKSDEKTDRKRGRTRGWENLSPADAILASGPIQRPSSRGKIRLRFRRLGSLELVLVRSGSAEVCERESKMRRFADSLLSRLR